jgi:hypothetical protein
MELSIRTLPPSAAEAQDHLEWFVITGHEGFLSEAKMFNA